MFLTFFLKYVKPVLHKNIRTNTYGLARTLLAIGTLLTFLFNDVHTLFRPAAGIPYAPVCKEVSQLGIFCLIPEEYLEISKWLAIIVLFIVASGWRPRYTGVIHWWISFSFMSSAIIVDGGDQIAAVITLLLIPITLTDNRRWHWEIKKVPPKNERFSYVENFKRIVAYTFYVIIRIQVAVVYLQAVIAKTKVDQWMNGTALYYWFNDPFYGASNLLMPFLEPVLLSSISLTLVTWSILVVEILLFAALFMQQKWWSLFFKIGLLLHLGIAIIHGLISFFFAMAGALVLYLFPITTHIKLPYNFSTFLKQFSLKHLNSIKNPE